MDHISRLLPRVLQKRGIAAHAHAAFAVHRAQQWLEGRFPALEGAVHAVTLRDGTLFIECDYPIAQQECQSAAEELRSFLNRETSTIKEIRILRRKSSR